MNGYGVRGAVCPQMPETAAAQKQQETQTRAPRSPARTAAAQPLDDDNHRTPATAPAPHPDHPAPRQRRTSAPRSPCTHGSTRTTTTESPIPTTKRRRTARSPNYQKNSNLTPSRFSSWLTRSIRKEPCPTSRTTEVPSRTSSTTTSTRRNSKRSGTRSTARSLTPSPSTQMS